MHFRINHRGNERVALPVWLPYLYLTLEVVQDRRSHSPDY